MRISKEDATSGQGIDERRLDLRMPAEAAHPIVEVVDSDKQNIGTPGLIGGLQERRCPHTYCCSGDHLL